MDQFCTKILLSPFVVVRKMLLLEITKAYLQSILLLLLYSMHIHREISLVSWGREGESLVKLVQAHCAVDRPCSTLAYFTKIAEQ